MVNRIMDLGYRTGRKRATVPTLLLAGGTYKAVHCTGFGGGGHKGEAGKIVQSESFRTGSLENLVLV